MANTFNHNDKVVITDGGSVGIGTTSPSYKLDVNGASRFTENVTAGNSNSNSHIFKGNSFTIDGSTPYLYLYDNSNSYGGGATMGIYFSTTGGSQGFIGVPSTSYNDIYITNDPAQGTVAGEASGHAHILLLPHNNVGIGTTSPSYTLDVSGTQRVTGNVVFEGQISFPGVNGNNFVIDTDEQRIVWEHQRNGTRKMVFYHETDADTFNFSFASGNNLQINGNRIVTANELGTAAASAATDFVAVSGDTMSGDLNMGSNDIKSVNSIVLNNVEGSSFGTVNGTLIFDENFYGDTEYGTAWAGGNGGGLAIYGEDGWNRMLSDKNAQWFLGTAAFSRSDDFVAVTGDTMSGNLTISNSSPDLFFETGATHYNWMVAAQENVNAGFEISVGSQDADSSNDTWSPKLVILQSGNVGIGTTSPSYRLHVASADDSVVLIESNGTDATDDARLELKTTNGTFAIQNDRSLGASGALTFAGNTSNNLLIDHNSGNVGIGTTSPSYKLTVAGRISIENDILHITSASPKILLSVPGGGIDSQIYNDGAGNFIIGHGANSDTPGEKLRIDSTGNVGIGTTSPTAKLTIDSSSTPQLLLRNPSGANSQILLEDNGGGTQNASITFDQTGQNTLTIATGYQSSTDENKIHLAPAGNIGLTVRGGTGSSNGNVGIGTTSPDQLLHTVGGTVKIESDGAAAAGAILELKHANNNTTDVCATINMTNGVGGYAAIEGGTTGANNTGYIAFKTDNAGTQGEAMRIIGNGNVGIGTTAPGSTFTVVGSNTSSVPLLDLTASGSGAWQRGVRLLNTGMSAGDSIMMAVGNRDNSKNMGQFYFYYAGNASNSNRISMGLHSVDDVFNILGTGNVGIGTTTPGSKLTTIGTIQTSRTSAESENLLFYSQQTAKWGSSTYPGVIESYGNNSMIIGSGQNVPIYIARSGAIALTIGTGGNVGIGTTSPGYKLDVSGDIRATGAVISGGQQLVIPAVGRFLFDSTTDYNTATEGSIAISTEGAIQGGDNTVYTINERDITFNESGFYKISVYITYTSTTQRANPGIRLKKNGTDYISPWGLSGYLRYASGHNEASNFVDTIAYFDEGDYVEVYRMAFAASGTCTDDGSGSHILIERIAM